MTNEDDPRVDGESCAPATGTTASIASSGAPTPVQHLYNLTTWLLSRCPSGILEEGATQPYHDALRALTNYRDNLRRSQIVQHAEEWWQFDRKSGRAATTKGDATGHAVDADAQ